MQLAVSDVENELPGELVGEFESVDADLHLTLIEVFTMLGVGQAGDGGGQRQQAEELGDLQLLAIRGFVTGAHEGLLEEGVAKRGTLISLVGGRELLKQLLRFVAYHDGIRRTGRGEPI